MCPFKSLNSPSWLQERFGHKSRPWVEGAAADRRWTDTIHMRCWWVSVGATGRSMWYQDPLGRSCSSPGRGATSRGESRARSLQYTARPSWSLKCQPGRNAAQWCSAHRRERTRTPKTQSLIGKDKERLNLMHINTNTKRKVILKIPPYRKVLFCLTSWECWN